LEFETEQAQNAIDNPGYLILDARAEARYRGKLEPIDAIVGHIQGVISSPF
jgi:thiosulfate/3-mercaptopyruvate sulfurtransferase